MILVWSGLVILVLYSPIGSPDLYTSQNLYFENNSLTFIDGAIPNASKIKSLHVYNDDVPELFEISDSLHGNYDAGNYNLASVSSSQIYSSRGVQTGFQKNNFSEGAEEEVSFIVNGRSGSRSTGSGFTMTSGISTMSLSSDLNTASPKINVTGYTAEDDGTDPGGNPDGNPIPVGDDSVLFILFGLCYTLLKKGSFKKLLS